MARHGGEGTFIQNRTTPIVNLEQRNINNMRVKFTFIYVVWRNCWSEDDAAEILCDVKAHEARRQRTCVSWREKKSHLPLIIFLQVAWHVYLSFFNASHTALSRCLFHRA